MIVPPATGTPPTVTLPFTLPSRLPQPAINNAAPAKSATRSVRGASIVRVNRLAPFATCQPLKNRHRQALGQESHVPVGKSEVGATRVQTAERDVVFVVHQHRDDRV